MFVEVTSEAGRTCAGATEEEAKAASTRMVVRNDTDIQTIQDAVIRREE